MEVRRAGGIGLEYLSVFGMPLPEYIALARRLEFDFVSVNFRGAANAMHANSTASLKECEGTRDRLLTALADHEMRLELVEGFAISPQLSAVDYAHDLDTVACLGARSICVISLEKDLRRAAAEFGELARMAGERGLRVTSEVGAGMLRSIQIAHEVWKEVASPDFTLLIDAMHFFRRGGTLGDIDGLPAEAIGHVQLCDVPMPAQIENYMEEALFERRCPGDGDLPLTEFLTKIPASIPIGLEVPVRSASGDLEATLANCLARTQNMIGTA